MNTLPSQRMQIIGLRKLVLRILLPLAVIGVVVCLGLDWLVENQIIQKTPSHGAAKLLRIREPHPDEIPIIGSSRALCSYIPDSLGTNYYNYGINGIGYAVMDVFLQQELAQRDKTGPIVLNFDYGMFYYQTGDLNAYIPNLDIPGLRELVKRGGRYSGHLELPGIRYFGCLDAFVRDHLNDRLQLTKAINKGAVLEKQAIKAEEFAKLVNQRKDTVEKFEPRMELVDTLVKRIQAHPNREFLIVMAPYHSSFYASISPEGRFRADSIMAALDALPNARFIRFDTRDWADSLFFNTTHVGLAGARKMSQMLRDSLRGPMLPKEDTLGQPISMGEGGLELKRGGGLWPKADPAQASGTAISLRRATAKSKSRIPSPEAPSSVAMSRSLGAGSIVDAAGSPHCSLFILNC
ncbi:MAG: hypothetical protein U0176_22400 [Bacteroidia bacterium]